MANERKQQQKKGKVARVPFGSHRYKLQLSEEDMKEFKRRGMVPRWFNDQDGRIQRALGGGYKFVKPEHATSLGSGAIHQGNTDEGSRVSKIVSKGEPVIRAYLMEISKRFWNEDQAAKEAINMQVDEALAVGQAGGAEIENQYGKGVTYSH
jgi:hypothetical protein